MNLDDLKVQLREQAEVEYHDRLRAIDSDVEAKFAALSVELAVIDEAEKRAAFAFAQMRDAAIVRHGFAVPTNRLMPNFIEANDPRLNP